VFGCMPIALTAKDHAAINAGDKGLVLVRVLCTVDGKPFEQCIFRRNDPLLSDKLFIRFALGSFDTFGAPGYVKMQALSDASFDEGWASLVLPPGIYYLYIRGPDASECSHSIATDSYSWCYRDAPCWRIDIPEHAKLVYAGSLTLAGKVDGTLIFGDKIIVPVKDQEVPLSDEREFAAGLLAQHFPGTEVHTILMRRWHPGDPFIFRSPLPGSVK